ncbi:hypothetical protein JYT20_01510, partial [Rhodothermus sp. AH-315-K08]|nr:hypothetical protein [Rhodothermus sp. AH-315-K08]
LVGNTGVGAGENLEAVLALLRNRLHLAGENAVVVFLGDQLAGGGLPEPDHSNRTHATARLDSVMASVFDFPGRVFFIPGDQDYGLDQGDRVEALLRQEDYIETFLDRGNVFLPDGGSPGPHEMKLTDDLRLVALNTDWLLRESGTYEGGGEARETIDVYRELQDVVSHRQTDDLLVVGHHPVFSNGTYGGHNPGYLVPPIHALRGLAGNEQYFSHERNEWMREGLLHILIDHENFVYASAHERSLQYIQSEPDGFSQSFLVSGSGSGGAFVVENHSPEEFRVEHAGNERGIMSLSYYLDGSIWLDIWSAERGDRRPSEHMLRRPEANTATFLADQTRSIPDDSSRVMVPDAKYQAGLLHRLMLGRNHRQIWATPVEVRVPDLAKEEGGLTAIKRGGGLQSTSIRLENPDGKQFVFRSIRKDWRASLPRAWRQTIVGSVVNDFVSITHPYSALPVPHLAGAIGIYHANPRIIVVPDDPRLGSFRNLIGGQMVLFEERPNKDMSDASEFGNSEDVVGWAEMYRSVTRDNDDRVDARFLARNRLFDMWISDWDRHRDQWRWASFEDPDGQGTLYRPIPRDRDTAFLVLDTPFYPLVKPLVKIQDYRDSFGSIRGLTQNATNQDHRFLSELSRSDWIEIADSMRLELTDLVIENAFREWPAAVYELHGPEMIGVAQTRRDQLPEIAEKFYWLHARSVDVVGSNKHEQFEVRRVNDYATEVVVFKIDLDGEKRQEIYRRLIYREETREINLYGLGGDDVFLVTGEVRQGIRINAVGGSGDDKFADFSKVRGWLRMTHFYDTPLASNSLQPGEETRVHLSDDPGHNLYPRTYNYERVYPIPFAAVTSEDGLAYGAVALWTRYAFQKEGYARTNSLLLRYATGPDAFEARYKLTAYQALGNWNAGIDLLVSDPNNITNFHGLGNETSGLREDQFRRGLAHYALRFPIQKGHETGRQISVTPVLEIYKVSDRFLEDLAPLDPRFFRDVGGSPQSFTGMDVQFDLNYRDIETNPRHGYTWTGKLKLRAGV